MTFFGLERNGTRQRPRLRTVLVCVLLWAVAFLLVAHKSARGFDIRFEWDSAHGFKVFRVEHLRQNVATRAWDYVVALQVKPFLASYLRRGHLDPATGNAYVRAGTLVPVVFPAPWDELSLKLDTGVTPLMRAAKDADLRTLQKLLSEGADLNARDWLGRTAVLHASVHGNIDARVIKALLAAGADVNIPDNGGRTPLFAAMIAANDRLVIIRDFLEAGADVNAKNVSGSTALMQAAASGDIESVKLLLAKGADASVRNSRGLTALSLAERRNQAQVVELLKREEAQAGGRARRE